MGELLDTVCINEISLIHCIVVVHIKNVLFWLTLRGLEYTIPYCYSVATVVSKEACGQHLLAFFSVY